MNRISNKELNRRTDKVEIYQKRIRNVGLIILIMVELLDSIITGKNIFYSRVNWVNIYVAVSSIFYLWKGYYLDKKATRRWAMVGVLLTIIQIILWILTMKG